MPVGDVRYEPDHDGIAKWALSNDVGDTMFDFAKAGEDFGRQIAPVGKNTSHRKYANSFSSSRIIVRAGWKGEPRAGAVIVNDSDAAIFVERRKHVLGRVATALDGRKRYWNMTARERASARRRVSNIKKRKRASSR